MKTTLMAGLLLICLTGTCFAGLHADTRIVDMADLNVAYTEYVGDYDRNPNKFESLLDDLIDWAYPKGLFDFSGKTKLVTLFPDELNGTAQDKRRLQVAITVPRGTATKGKIKAMTVPGGYYLVGRFTITDEEMGEAWVQMFDKWLPECGYDLAEGPLFQILENDPDTHPKRKNVIDIYIPVSK